ncbi:uncharacterized protein LOC127705811 [Mytilus californianus]|uniref:uncharacterized protein LOC127705811 n=1 Tax=Mytilus californianus TaxID=6549 RepID=UPI002245D94E|nr:uncharacterized protein LOC127705811 [Mytilus californianus]
MSVSLFSFIIALTQDITTQVNVDLQGPLYAKSGDKIWVNCSSNTVPAGETAEFLVNGDTINSLRRHNNDCYSATTRKKCIRDICQCSNNGKTYGIRININQQRTDVDVEIVCSMKFKIGRTFFINDSISVQVLDITSPKISPVGSPLVSGTNINLSCSIITSLEIQMHWNCLNFTSVQVEQINSTFTAILFLHLRSSYNGRICTCIARFKQITSSATITLNISSPPLVTVSNPTECNLTSNIMLFCVLSGELQTYGFNLWTHKINEQFIRYIEGNVNKATLTLLISSCSFEDSGEYICRAWNQIGKEKYVSNKTTTITVNHAPIITETNRYTEPNVTYVVQYYSNSPTFSTMWFKNTELLTNSMLYSMTLAAQNVSLEMYGKMVVLPGYSAKLGIPRDTLGDYTLILTNEFGETQHSFEQIEENASEKYEQRSTQHNVDMTTESHTENSLSITYGPLAGGLVLFVSLFVGVNIGINRKCRTVNFENGEEFTGPNIPNSNSIANTDTQPPQIEHNLSVYETINENEMMQVPVGLDMLNKTEAASVSSCSSTSKSSSASNRSYLEVVDYSFYLKPYEILQCNTDSDFVHLYSTTVDQFEYKLDSSSTESSTCPQRNFSSELKQESVTISPEQSSLSFLPTISNEYTANDDNLISVIKECGATKTPAIMTEMDCWNISNKAETNRAVSHSLSKSISDYQYMSDANSDPSIEIDSSSNPVNAMSTFL